MNLVELPSGELIDPSTIISVRRVPPTPPLIGGNLTPAAVVIEYSLERDNLSGRIINSRIRLKCTDACDLDELMDSVKKAIGFNKTLV